MRILHVITRYQRGGTERDLAHTARWELGQGHEVHVAVGRDSVVTDLPTGVTSHVIGSLVRDVSPIHDIRAWWSLRNLIERGRYDLVHTHQSKAGVIGRVAARGRAQSLVHTISMQSFGQGYGRFASMLFVLAERLCAKSTTTIIAVGEELVGSYLQEGIGRASQYCVIRSPIDLSPFIQARTRSSGERQAVRISLGVKPDLPMAVVIGTLEPRKRVDLIIRALAPAVHDGALSLVIAGDGSQRAALTALCQREGIGHMVRFLGHVDDVPELMSAAKVLVCAGSAEGVPQVVIQALAVGTAIVATDSPGLREVASAPIRIVEPDGDGLLPAVLSRAAKDEGPVEPDVLNPWSPAAVDEQLRALYIGLFPGTPALGGGR